LLNVRKCTKTKKPIKVDVKTAVKPYIAVFSPTWKPLINIQDKNPIR
jgi:hypothetical protein